jgi:hypothetical protein
MSRRVLLLSAALLVAVPAFGSRFVHARRHCRGPQAPDHRVRALVSRVPGRSQGRRSGDLCGLRSRHLGEHTRTNPDLYIECLSYTGRSATIFQQLSCTYYSQPPARPATYAVARRYLYRTNPTPMGWRRSRRGSGWGGAGWGSGHRRHAARRMSRGLVHDRDRPHFGGRPLGQQ